MVDCFRKHRVEVLNNKEDLPVPEHFNGIDDPFDDMLVAVVKAGVPRKGLRSYFGDRARRVSQKYKAKSKNIPRYYTLNRLIRDLLSNMFSNQSYKHFCHARPGELRRVQMLWNICTRFARCLYLTKGSRIIKWNTRSLVFLLFVLEILMKKFHFNPHIR